jgi:putative phosphoribosyl transferase
MNSLTTRSFSRIGWTPGGVRVLDEMALDYLAITLEQLERITAAETEEMERRERLYRGDRPAPDIRDKTVILVDDGLATGVTARAAIRSARQQQPRHLVLAVPVCAPEMADALRAEADEVICVSAPASLRAVGLWYEDFRQVSDAEVIALLKRAQQEAAAPV